MSIWIDSVREVERDLSGRAEAVVREEVEAEVVDVEGMVEGVAEAESIDSEVMSPGRVVHQASLDIKYPNQHHFLHALIANCSRD